MAGFSNKPDNSMLRKPPIATVAGASNVSTASTFRGNECRHIYPK